MAKKTVADVYQFDEDELHLKADDSEYWANCFSFYEQVKDCPIGVLSQKQIDWLERISEKLEADTV